MNWPSSTLPYNVGRPYTQDDKKHDNARFADLAHVEYLNPGERLSFMTQSDRKNSKLRCDMAGLPKPRLPRGEFRYVISPKGSLYVDWLKRGASHASLLRARPVQSAGWIGVSRGRIHDIDSCSGHYKPTAQQHLRAVMGLYRRGLLDAETRVGCYDDGEPRVWRKVRDLAEMLPPGAFTDPKRLLLTDRPPRPMDAALMWRHVELLVKLAMGVGYAVFAGLCIGRVAGELLAPARPM